MKSASTTEPRPSAAGAKRCAAGMDTIRASRLARHMQVNPMRALAIAICLAALPACGTEQAATPLAAAPGADATAPAPAPAAVGVQVDIVAQGFEQPWAVPLLHDGGCLVTRRPGRPPPGSAGGENSGPT